MFITSPLIPIGMSVKTQRFDKEVKVNKENSIKRIRSDYDFPWIGLIREIIQNSTDGWGFNKKMEFICEELNLEIEFEIDTESETLIVRDNAGGMTLDTLENNLIAIDNPSVDKADGKGAGSYGRGFWVIMSTGSEADVETYHESGIYATEISTKGLYSSIEERDEPELCNAKGTTYKIRDVKEEDMQYLSDWECVESELIKNFAPLLNDDNVTIRYTIDGEEHYPDAPDLNQLKEEYGLCHKEEVEPFTYHDEEHQVRDFVMIDATEMDEDIPWKGVNMYKGNDYLDYPFMRVQCYNATHVPSMRKPVKMFGWCDASDLCRPREDGKILENNAHDKFQLKNIGKKTHLRDEVYDIHDEHFKHDYTTEDKEELFQNIKNTMNNVLDTLNNHFEDFSTAKSEGVGTGGTPQRTPNSQKLSFLRCKTDTNQLELGEEITLGLGLNPREELDYEEYELFDLQVKNTTVDEVVEEYDSLIVKLEPNKPYDCFLSTFEPEEEGRYVFSAKVRGDDEQNDVETKDKSRMTFVVGDVDKTEKDKRKDSEGSVEFISNIRTYAKSDAGRAFVSDQDEDGLVLHVNTKWPTLVKKQEELRGKEFQRAQEQMFTSWGLSAVVDFWGREKFKNDGASDQLLALFDDIIQMRQNIEKEQSMSEGDNNE